LTTALSRVPELSGAAARLAAARWITLEGTVAGRASIDGRSVLMLGSNDYLGLAAHPHVVARARAALEEHGAGTGMNPVVGLTRVHRDLIEAMRTFTGCEDVLLFNSCTAANCALIPTLVGDQDAVISDELNHASIIDACRLARGRTVVYRHGDVDDLNRALEAAASARLRLVVTDGVFSMEGVAAPLPEIIGSAAAADAAVVVDESHALGVLGASGRGTGERYGIGADAFVQTGTFSKALGAGLGGYVAGSADLIAHLRSRARFFIFTSGMPAAAAGAALGALEVLAGDRGVLDRLRQNASHLRRGLETLGMEVLGSDGPIVPVVVGDAAEAHRVSACLLEEGIFGPAFSDPIVPVGSARLRLQVSAAHTTDDLDFVLETFERVCGS
jgi:glycine C-acetyltransferase